MNNRFLPLVLLLIISFSTSCEQEDDQDDIQPENETIHIPDEHFKAALVSTNSIDTNNDRVGDSDMDLNNDGEIQRFEAEMIESLIINFKSPGKIAI